MEEINLIIGIVVGIFGVIAYIKGFFGWVWGKIKALFTKKDGRITIPKKTLSILIKGTGSNCWWHMGSVGGEPSMQIVARFTATNICDLGILPISAKMKKPKILGNVITQKHDQNVFGSHIIPKGYISQLTAYFWITPPVKNKGETFKTNIAIIDQFGNKNWIKRVGFKYK